MMVHEPITIRKATQKDAADLAIIDNMASFGMSLAFWQHAVTTGEAEDVLVFARERFADKGSIFGWKNAFVAENENEGLGAVTVYEMPEPDDEIDEIKRLFPRFVPVFELFGETVGDWFIDSLGVFPQARGNGIGGRLVNWALERSKEQNYKTAALVVESDNEPAVALYEAKGFSKMKSLPKIEEDAKGEWLLMKAVLS